jgi:hypothetical protein
LFIRLAYADSLRGPWRVHEPGVLKVENTAFHRPQPDPADSPPGAYTHVASPEVYEAFELGESPFRDTPYAGRVRHVALLVENDRAHVFFSAIGDAPESILHTR